MLYHNDDHQIPSVDVCAFCADGECDGIQCIASLDPDNPDDHELIEMLHALLRAGAAHFLAEKALAQAENRSPLHGTR